MTTRERREARAERLRDWSGKRAGKAQATAERAQQLGERFSQGQPILPGHHSQGRAEADHKRMHRAMEASVDHSRKAQSFSSRADNIEAAADRAIYRDDPDAREKLAVKIEKLEHERMLIKQANAAYKAEHKAELKVMTFYHRDQAMPFASYVLTNLSGNLNRARKRLESLPPYRETAA
ncbi:MAG TPA: DUF3560 domain-containing protein [Solirubrobacteraceae bacterium]